MSLSESTRRDVPLIPPGHSLPTVDFDLVGPAVGDRFPDLMLPNQDGVWIDLHQARNGRPGFVIVHRSAEW